MKSFVNSANASAQKAYLSNGGRQVAKINVTGLRRAYSGSARTLEGLTTYVLNGYEYISEILPSRIMQNGITIDSNCLKSNAFSFGNATSKEVEVKLSNFDGVLDDFDFDGSVFYIWMSRPSDTTFSTHALFMGKFTIDTIDMDDVVTLGGLDDIVNKLDVTWETSLNFNSGTVTFGEMFAEVCTQCGFTNGSTTFQNSDIYCKSKPFGSVTCREIVGWIAEISGANVYLRDASSYSVPSTLYIKGFDINHGNDYPVYTIGKSVSFSKKAKENTVQFSGVILHDINNSYTASYVVDVGDGDVVYTIQNNKLLTSLEMPYLATSLAPQRIYEDTLKYWRTYNPDTEMAIIDKLHYFPFSDECQSLAWIEPMDQVIYEDKKGNKHNSIVTHTSWTLDDSMLIESVGQGKTYVSYSSS